VRTDWPGPPVAAGISDIALTPARAGRIEVRAAAIRGSQHRAVGDPRQDDFALGVAAGVADSEDLVAVVCDGVGLFARSQEAASLAARRLVELARRGETWAAAFATVNDELDQRAWDRHGAQPTTLNMATTVLAVRVHVGTGGWHGQAAWVGDSPLWHLTGDGRWVACTHPMVEQDQETHRTWSSSLPTRSLRVAEMELDLDTGALFLMSDGIGDPLARHSDVGRTLAQWWAAPPDIFEFGRQVGFARDSYGDDRTVVGLWLQP
jgi:serine/threonine protein phosphatase PrpC